MHGINNTTPPDEAAAELIKQLDAFGVDYAIGGALAMGLWSEPRATLDVDMTLFLGPKHPEQCVKLLQTIGCRFENDDSARALSKFREFSFCQVALHDCAVDVFLPTQPLLLAAKHRRTTFKFCGRETRFWNAEVMAVLKMMFYRPKDFPDLEKMIRAQGANYVLLALSDTKDTRLTHDSLQMSRMPEIHFERRADVSKLRRANQSQI